MVRKNMLSSHLILIHVYDSGILEKKETKKN